MEPDFANSIIEEIEKELHEYHEQTGIRVRNHKVFNNAKPNFKFMYENGLYCLPYHTMKATPINGVDRLHFEIFFHGIKDDHPALVEDGVEAAVEAGVLGDYPPETILTFIQDKLSQLSFNYTKVLSATRAYNVLQGVHEEELIIKNHLNRYEQILNSNEKQIELAQGLVISKKISDLVLQAFIKFLKCRLQIINPEAYFSKKGQDAVLKQSNPAKLFWKGSQKELCELIVSLLEKKWIAEIPQGELTKTVNAICNLIDISATQRSPETNPVTSLYQILKGKWDQKEKKHIYLNVFGKNYKYKFKAIDENEQD